MTKFEIEIEGLPEGWEAVSYKIPSPGIDHILTKDGVMFCDDYEDELWLIVQKTKPRRIVLEETEERNSMRDPQCFQREDVSIQISSVRFWKEVKEGE